MIEELMKILSDKTRLRIINVLSEKPRCVCELTEILDLPQSTVSRHLSKMKLIKLLFTEKDGVFIKYKLNNEFLEKYSFLNYLLDDLKNEFKEDLIKSEKVIIKDGVCVIK
ncbi:metalloregulator ArsR/SmtB family transcription factor [Marinitoga litoralis]|uniref:metalloregulator ArsR/SmtB family transcription factor n=1 Tax=Marinitoga litoralis TaxID=570855 RepID=UPI00195F84D0|nr:ArsR family transcriptional regulator [Marinitoga litoralis]